MSGSAWMLPWSLLVVVGLAGCGGGGGGGSGGAPGGGGGGGGGGGTVQLPPNLTFDANVTTVRQGESVTLSWSTTTADSCTASGAWSGSRAVNGSETHSNLQQSSSYTLTCANNAGSTIRTVDITVPMATPHVDVTISPSLVERGSEVTVTWSAPWATECVAQWAVIGTPPRLPPEGSARILVPANYSVTTFRAGVQCSGAPGNFYSVAETTVKTLSGEVRIPQGVYVDTDVNDPNAEYVSNEMPVKELPVFGLAPGYVNVAGQGPPGRSFAAGDPWDYYFLTNDVPNQVVRLRLPTVNTAVAPAERDDADLYLYDRDSGDVIDVSMGSSGEELIQLPGTGSFVVGVNAVRGGFNYVLSLEDPPLASNSTHPTLTTEFVPGEAIVTMATRAAGNAVQRKAGEAGRETLVTFSTTVPATAAPTHQKQGRAWFGQKAEANLSSEIRAKLATLQEIKRLSQTDGVKHATVNRIFHAQLTPTDPLYVRQRWHYEAAKLPAAWDITTGSSNVIVAVIDSGAVMNHPDLQSKFVDGYDMVDRDSNPLDTGFDSGGVRIYHGSHVMGTVGAVANNGNGGAGIAWGSRIMPIRALAGRSGSSYDILQAVRYAAGLPNDSGRVPTQRADIINLSLGSAGSCDPAMAELFTTVANSGVVVVASAGNDQSNVDHVPASCPTVFGVAATGPDGNLAWYSNFGSYVSLGAPGGDTRFDADNDSFLDGIFSTGGQANGLGYSSLQGTSMAAPHVAGIFALMKSVRPTLNPLEFRQLLEGGWLTDTVPSNGSIPPLGYGIINAHKAVQAANDDFTPPPRVGATPGLVSLNRIYPSALFDLRNTGIGALSITNVRPLQSWLTVTRVTVTPDGLGRYEATANLRTMTRGVYHGAVEVQSTAGTTQLPVVVNNVHFGYASGLGALYVRAIDASSSAAVRTLRVSDRIANFRFDDLPLGGYVTLAGTDMNNDGNLCDPGEVCGMYPVRQVPAPIEFTGVKERVNFDLQVTGIERQ